MVEQKQGRILERGLHGSIFALDPTMAGLLRHKGLRAVLHISDLRRT